MRRELKNIFVGLFTGILFSAGWVLFIDAQINTLDAFVAVHIVPCILSSIAGIAINLVSISRISESMEVKIWLFFWFTISCVAIGLAIWFIARDYAPPIPPYPGVSILLQTVFAMMASFLFFVGRKSTEDGDMYSFVLSP